MISPAGFEEFFRELGDAAEGGTLETQMPELSERYGLEMDPGSVPGLCERFGLRVDAG